jgi:catalase
VRHWVKFHFKTDQGIKNLTSEEAAVIGGKDPQHHIHDLYQAIEGGNHPSWTAKVQIMTEAEAATYRFNPFDLTKVWSQKDFPLIEIGKLVLDRVPDNYFAETEQSAFDPGHFVPGIGPSPDRMLQARLFAYGDAARYRLGANHTELPINTPHAVPGGARNYGRDGYMRGGANGGASKNYEPNSYGGPVQTGEPLYNGLDVAGVTGTNKEALRKDDNDFRQAGDLYRLMPADAKSRFIENIAGSLSQVTLEAVITRSIEHFRSADADLGERLTVAVRAHRSKR